MKYDIPAHSQFPVYRLSEKTLIGRGNKRDCHAHPDDPGLCIKVARHHDNWQECQEQSIVEWYYMAALKQRQVPLNHLADCHGWVQTSYGSGLVIERIRDEDGSPALTLRDAISEGKIDIEQTRTMLSRLKRWVIEHGVVVADLNGANLMVRRQANKESDLIFVDGIGSRKADWKFTLYQQHLWLARMKTKRQWQRQEPVLNETLKERLAKRKAQLG